MDVGELRRLLDGVPDDMPVMMPCEVGVDIVGSAAVVPVIKTLADWTGTPARQYRVVDQYLDEKTSGEAFQALVLDFTK